MVTSKEFNEAKNSLLRYYSSYRDSQGIHLIGFAAGLFTLIQTVQHSRQEPLSDIFSNLGELVPVLRIPPIWGEIAKPLVFFFSISVLLWYIIRKIFRFILFAYYSTYLMRVTKTEISNRNEPIHQEIHNIVTNKITNKKVYVFVRLGWFVEKRWVGYLLTLIFAILSTLILVWLLW